jgi:hypothetical protein
MKNPVIYTALYGGYDDLVQAPKLDKYRYVCFTDKPEQAEDKGWEVIHKHPTHDEPVRSAKIFKIRPHLFLEDHDVSLWVDANVQIIQDPEPMLTDCLENHDMALFAHYFIDNLIGEVNECIKCEKDDPKTMTDQVDRYIQEGFPQISNTHHMCTFIARRHNQKAVKSCMDFWWNEIENNSYRDQLSCSYSLWKNKLPCCLINADWKSFFRLNAHIK